ncbi:hypothetical protein PTKIN_Ptkin17bG0160800 [Pterospermum kingtungense]
MERKRPFDGGKRVEGDWRANFHSVFINNLSKRVSKQSLWEAFNAYGRVADVYINFHSNKSYTFAFVRYKWEGESRKAIVEGDNRVIDGRMIRVKKAFSGWKAMEVNMVRKRPVVSESKNASRVWHAKERKSYKEALVGSVVSLDAVAYQEGLEKTKKSDEGLRKKQIDDETMEFSFNLEVPENEMSWLENSVIGRLKEQRSLERIRETLVVNGIKCQVSPMGGASCCLIFESSNDMNSFLDRDQVVAIPFLDEFHVWDRSLVQRKVDVWVILDEVPLQLWNEYFFKSLANQWGSYIKIDECTLKRERLDYARILVKVESKFNIPAFVTVRVNGQCYKISISLEDDVFQKFVDVKQDGVEMAVKSQELKICSSEKENGLTDDIPWVGDLFPKHVDSCNPMEFSLMLSEEEIGGSLKLHKAQDVIYKSGINLMVGDLSECFLGDNVLGENVDSGLDNWAIQIVNKNGLEMGNEGDYGSEKLMDCGPITLVKPDREVDTRALMLTPADVVNVKFGENNIITDDGSYESLDDRVDDESDSPVNAIPLKVYESDVGSDFDEEFMNDFCFNKLKISRKKKKRKNHKWSRRKGQSKANILSPISEICNDGYCFSTLMIENRLEEETAIGVSDWSLSDNDICHRNEMIIRELYEEFRRREKVCG